MRSMANLIDHVLPQYRWHGFASKAVRLVAFIERHVVRDLYGVRGEWRIVEPRAKQSTVPRFLSGWYFNAGFLKLLRFSSMLAVDLTSRMS